ncbi:retrovirus-related pol polyprotein from transposon TNT 1-94 [Tanacetum coccineum]
MTTLADKSLLSGGDNKPPMLEKHLYDSWKSQMELYMLNRPHGRMILASLKKGTPDCDIKAINIILQGLPTEIYALVSQHRVAKDLWEKIKLLMQGTSLTKQEREFKLYENSISFTYKQESRYMKSLEGSLWYSMIEHLKDALEQFQLRTSSNPRQQATIYDGKVIVQPVQGRQTTYAAGTTRKYTPRASGSNTGKQQTIICYNCKGEVILPSSVTIAQEKGINGSMISVAVQAQEVTVITHNAAHKSDDLDPYDSDCDELNSAKIAPWRKSFLGIRSDALTATKTENNHANKALTTELDIYKEEVKDLKEMQNVENSFSGSNEQYAEIVRLKQTLSEQVQEKDSLMKTVSDLKNDLKMEENRNIDREIALEKKIKQLDNIIFKRGQSAQTVHMMTKSKICYDHSTKQAIGFEKPFYLKKARESKPKLYDGNVILKMDAIVIPDSDETLMLCEESRSKMLLKEKDPMVVKHKVNTKPINYAILNNDYNNLIYIVNMPIGKRLRLKELKRHLTGFDQVVKERTTATAITEGTWGFEHTKACFRDEIILFIKGLKYIFNNINQYLVDEIADVQNVFYQIEQAVKQHRLESRTFEVKMNQVLSEHERLLAQAIDHDIVQTVVNLSVNDGCETVNECQKCLKLKTELLNKNDFTNSVLDQNAPSFTQLFELSELRAQSQEKDTVIVKLKEQIKSLRGNVDDSKVKMDMDEIETLNIELEHRVTKVVAENEHLKQNYKQLYDSIKPKHVQSKEQCDALIKQVNIKSGEISDLNAKLQEQGLVIAALKNELRKLKGKALDKEAIETHSVDPNVSKDNVEPITPKLLNKRTAHSSYIKHTQEEALVLRDIVEHVKANYPQDSLLESAFRYTKVIQELLSNISRTCPSINNFDPQLVAVTPRKKDKKVRFAESLTSTENTKTDSTSNIVSNKHVLHSTGVRLTASATGSQPSGNTRNDKILQTPSSNSKNKVEAHSRNVKSSLNKRNGTVKVNGSASVQNSKKHDNSDYVCINGDDCMSSDNLCVSNSMNDVKFRAKPKKRKSKKEIWKPTGKVFTKIGYIWRPTGRTFTIVGNACPLTRITTTNEVPSRKPIVLESESPKPVVNLVYSRKPRKNKNTESVSKTKVVQIVLWYLDSGCSKHMTGDRSQLTNFISKFLGTVKFGNDQVAKIMGYGDYQIGNVTISRVYYVEGLGHNLFSVGQFCDSNLEVAFRQHTCFIRNLEGVDLLTGSQGDNLYTLSLRNMMASSPICLLSKALKTKSWLWYRKSLKKSHKPKSEDTNQEKLYLLHMGLCGPMRVVSVNGKKYILVIVDDYSRFTWVKCLRSKDEAPAFIINFLKMIQVRLKETVHRIRTNNGTEFVNQTLREYYEKVGISHETSVAHSLQQNGVVERRNCTLIEAARTMLIYAKALLFLWAEAVATACYTQNRSMICRHHGKTPYELLHDKPPDLSYLHVFGALCYPTNDGENLGKLQPKADIGIFIGYAPTKKAFRIYKKHTRRIIKTIHVDFDELTAMASEHSS